ncbi:AMP-binding protein [Pseudodesulfovibrio sp. JC047]|uniref:DVU_1553 family AMP-dependent CoA ligase n=1 Tax=Pseudodesulfovibrio sp. JC047 TaxID=2683199 RepID=UPI0013D516A8|nr:AMP-binding protein [Pseudodesulfovibrio sp. JC047]NDV19874.1 AMP-binding protein [Pseudodesulfovibrio sp. JC047]
MALSVLDRWLIRRMGWRAADPPTARDIRRWQCDRLQTLVSHAQANSPFYARHLAGVDGTAIVSPEEYATLPMMTADEVRDHGERMVCVSQDAIARVVTVTTSGTTGRPKRIFQTAEDLEATIDYFAWGMKNLVAPGQTVLVLMPADRPGGVGRLLVEAIERIGARAVTHGVMQDVEAALDQCREVQAQSLVGSSSHIHMLACAWEKRGVSFNKIQSVLLCWDSVPNAVVHTVERVFGCRVFRHWGMIETGLGGAVECAPHSGMHLRETDVYVEIIDPETGELRPDGAFGEIVVSTPLRLGMPLIRYRTGDMGRILPDRCECKSPLRRLDTQVFRKEDGVKIGSGVLTMRDLNEVLYAVPGLDDFCAWYHDGHVRVLVCGDESTVPKRVQEALGTMSVVEQGMKKGLLTVDVAMKNDGTPAVSGLGKRSIVRELEK